MMEKSDDLIVRMVDHAAESICVGPTSARIALCAALETALGEFSDEIAPDDMLRHLIKGLRP